MKQSFLRRSKMGMKALVLHEAEPGHHTQVWRTRENSKPLTFSSNKTRFLTFRRLIQSPINQALVVSNTNATTRSPSTGFSTPLIPRWGLKPFHWLSALCNQSNKTVWFPQPIVTLHLQGWALYAEALGEEYNLYTTQYEKSVKETSTETDK